MTAAGEASNMSVVEAAKTSAGDSRAAATAATEGATGVREEAG